MIACAQVVKKGGKKCPISHNAVLDVVLSKGGKLSLQFCISSKNNVIYLFIYPYLTYCLEVWGSAAKVYITSVEKVQKLACRIITSMPPRTSSALLFTMLNFLNFNAI